MDLEGARLSFSFTNKAGSHDPAPIMTEDEIAIGLLKEVVQHTPDNELRKEGYDAKLAAEQSGDGTKKAISKIFEVLLGLGADKMQSTIDTYLRIRDSKAAAIQKFFDVSKEWTNPESESVQIAILKAIESAAASGDAEAIEMQQAMRNGDLLIEDMADYGLETKSSYIVYLDAEGNYVVGTSSITHVGEYFKAKDLFEDLTTINDNGQRIDKKTGNRAAYIQIAKNLSFYITWPSS